MAIKSHLPGTSISIGYESEQGDKAIIKCLVDSVASHDQAIKEAVTTVGDLYFSGTYNMPLLSAEAEMFGNEKWNVTLSYGRSSRSPRRNPNTRRVTIESVIDFVPAYLVKGTTKTNGYFLTTPQPADDDWFAIQFRPGNKQTPELVPKQFKAERPLMRVTLSYNTEFLTVGSGDLAKLDKLNSLPFLISEIGYQFPARTLRYEGFESSKNDIGQRPWQTRVTLLYDPSGHYKQVPLWDQTLATGDGAWKVDNTRLASEEVPF